VETAMVGTIKSIGKWFHKKSYKRGLGAVAPAEIMLRKTDGKPGYRWAKKAETKKKGNFMTGGKNEVIYCQGKKGGSIKEHWGKKNLKPR